MKIIHDYNFIKAVFLYITLLTSQLAHGATSSITFCGDNGSEEHDYLYVWAGLENGTNFLSDDTILCSNSFCRNKYKQEEYPSYPTTIEFDTQGYSFFDFDVYSAGWTNVGNDYPSPGNYYLALNEGSDPYLSTIDCYDAVSHALAHTLTKKKNVKN